MKPLRLAYVCADPGVPVFGRKGCSIHVQEVIRALRRRGTHVTLFAARTDGTPPADLQDLPVRPLPCPRESDLAQRERAAREANAALWSSLAGAGTFDAIYERYSLWSVAAQQFARAREIPGLLEVNAPLVEEQAAHRGLLDRAAAEDCAQTVFHAASVLLPVSAEIGSWLRENTQPGTAIEVIENGVNPERFAVSLRTRPSGEPFTIGFIGTLKPWHGLPVLVEAFARIHSRTPQVRLLIVGDGPERAALEAQLAHHSLGPATRFTGAVPPEEIPGLLESMDVAVAPYPPRAQFYFSPLKVYEYMAAGKPTVASRLGQIAKLIQHDENGLLCEPGDPADLAHQLIRLQRDPDLRHRLGTAGRATIQRSHTWDQVARRILHLAQSTAVLA